MNTKISVILVLVMSLFISGCNQSRLSEPAMTPTPPYSPVPRWMILGLPGQHIEIMGETWNYTDYQWGETYACIDYTRKKEPYVFFEQCFTLTQPDLTFESQRDAVLNDNYKTLTPNNTFGEVGQISLMAKRLEDNSTKFVKFFEIIGIEKYVLLVEMNLATDDTSSLQNIYEEQAVDIIDYVLQSVLEKSRLIPRPTATPLSPKQEGFYTSLAANLIIESEASVLYGNTWEALGDFVDPENPMVCRDFEGRTNADVLWVKFSNCIFLHHPDLKFDDFAKGYKKPDNIFLESSHQYDDKFLLYYKFPKLHAWIMHGEYLYYVEIESRTIHGEANVEEIFTKEIDDFIYGVLMINAGK